MNRLITFISFISILALTSCGKSAEKLLLDAEELDELGQYEQAIEILDQAIIKNPEYIGAFINRGAYKSSLNRFEDAISDYQKVLDLDPKNTLALYNIGNSNRQSENYHEALKYYDLAFKSKGGENVMIDYNPNGILESSRYDVPSAEIYYNRGLVHYDLKNYEKGFSDFQKALYKKYRVAESHYMIGACLIMGGNADLACAEFKKF